MAEAAASSLPPNPSRSHRDTLGTTLDTTLDADSNATSFTEYR